MSPFIPSLREVGILGGLVVLSFGLGTLVNALRADSLPWTHQAPVAELISTTPTPPEERQRVRVVNLEQARKIVEAKTALILDARPSLFYEMGHLPGARSLSRQAFDADFLKVLSKLQAARTVHQDIMVYCMDPECPDASNVARQLREKGYDGLLIFEGGWSDWQAAGLPEEK